MSQIRDGILDDQASAVGHILVGKDVIPCGAGRFARGVRRRRVITAIQETTSVGDEAGVPTAACGFGMDPKVRKDPGAGKGAPKPGAVVRWP